MSIFDTIGGASAVSVAVDKFYERVLSDSQLAHYVDKADLDMLKSHQRAFIAAAMGGPPSTEVATWRQRTPSWASRT